eukprot:7929937-Karenia_brevis.AAC.1
MRQVKAKGPLAFCQKCGAYFWHRITNLAKPCCQGKPHRGQVARLSEGRFPSAAKRYQHWRITKARRGTPEQMEILLQQLGA